MRPGRIAPRPTNLFHGNAPHSGIREASPFSLTQDKSSRRPFEVRCNIQTKSFHSKKLKLTITLTFKATGQPYTGCKKRLVRGTGLELEKVNRKGRRHLGHKFLGRRRRPHNASMEWGISWGVLILSRRYSSMGRNSRENIPLSPLLQASWILVVMVD